MANLASIKNRIASIKSTAKITKAMQMVAASKVKKSEAKAKEGRPFTIELVTMFANLVEQIGILPPANLNIERAIDNYPKLLEKRPIDTVGMLVITSNKGLAGAYNANVIKHALKKIKEYNENSIAVKLYVVGLKGISVLKHKIEKLNAQIVMEYTEFTQDPNAGQAQIIIEDMAEALISDQIDTIEVVVTTFKNMMSYEVIDFRLLPFEPKSEDIINKNNSSVEMIFEPSKYSILQKIVPMVLTNTIYHSLLEATASELASRMTAMSAACKNADEMITQLSVLFNKTRQTAITNEIIEVVSGANAV